MASIAKLKGWGGLSQLVIPREGGVSSTLRLLGSITKASGILDHPPARVMTTEYDAAFSRRVSPEVCIFICPPRKLRAQGRPGACCTRVRFALTKLHTSIQ